MPVFSGPLTDLFMFCFRAVPCRSVSRKRTRKNENEDGRKETKTEAKTRKNEKVKSMRIRLWYAVICICPKWGGHYSKATGNRTAFTGRLISYQGIRLSGNTSVRTYQEIDPIRLSNPIRKSFLSGKGLS